MSESKSTNKYYGLQKFSEVGGGYSVWIPLGWQQVSRQGFNGTAFYPDASEPATFFYVEKQKLKYRVTQKDLPTLQEGFTAGIQALPEVNILEQDQTVAELMFALDIKFTYVDQGETRKQWTRVVYSGKSQLVMTVQGADAASYDHFLPMFFNTMMSISFA